MNYLSHYYFNHHVHGLPPEPYFVAGVAIPDLWPRFSRKRRLRWRAIRTAQPGECPAAALRAGLLNHVWADRHFHSAAVFGTWIQHAKRGVPEADQTHPAVLEFVAHVAIELALDRALLARDATLADRFYDRLRACDAASLERFLTRLGKVDARGFGSLWLQFIARGFLHRYTARQNLVDIIRRIVNLTTIRRPPSGRLVTAVVDRACRLADPGRVWDDLARAGRPVALAG